MTKLARPPARLPALESGDLVTISKGTLLWRVYRTAGPHPARWDEFRSFGAIEAARFDHHSPPPHDDPDRSVLYAALDGTAAIAEAFQDTRSIDRRHRAPYLVAFKLARDVVALDLTGLWPTRAGASQAIASGRRDVARAWSRAIHQDHPEVEALRYRSAMAGGSRNVALYERARDAMPTVVELHLPLAHPGLDVPLRRLARTLGYGLI